ncbi:hypothetical protein LTR70_005510 [Exophiala xenobiotica]|nr:hypothetical protein LTR70_005510 [Exophiala xenobiotica]
MDDKFRGFCSETFTLIIGPKAKKLFVPKDILVQIPYFHSALSMQEVDTYVQAYIAADKFMAETTANRLLDELFEYHRHNLVCPKVIARLSAAGLENSDPYEVFCYELAIWWPTR